MASELISQQRRWVESEENFTLKLFMLIDLYEYCLKLLAVHQLQSFVRDIDTCKHKNIKAFKNICDVFIAGFQRPSFGHWIQLLRNATNATEPENKPLEKILIGADIVVNQRNRLAHGITPENFVAKEIYDKLYPLFCELEAYIQDYDVIKSIEQDITLTPFANTLHELYNGIKKKRVEFLNYSNGNVIELPVQKTDIDDFYKNYFDLKAHISQAQVQVLLSDYFPREHWEDELEARVRENQLTFLYGFAGVGKTILSARASQIVNGGFYRFSSVNKKTASARHAFIELYRYFRGIIGGVPNIAPATSPDDLRYYLHELSLKLVGGQYYYVFDGLDEISEGEIENFLTYLAIFMKPGMHFLVSARNMGLKKSLAKVDGSLAVIQLEAMTELEVKEWIKKQSPKIRYPSIELIRSIYNFSRGNFLFLANLKKDLKEREYLVATKETPKGVDAVFEGMTGKFAPKVLDAILLLVAIPGDVSQRLICKYLDINDSQFDKVKQQMLPVIKELHDEHFELFHDRYAEFLKRNYASRLKATYQKVFQDIFKLHEYIEPLECIPEMFDDQNDIGGLFNWCKAIVSDGYNNPLFMRDRYAYVSALTRSFSILLHADAEQFRSTLPVLDTFISNNFQLLFDWKFSATLCKGLDVYRDCIDIRNYEHVDLMYSCQLHINGDYKSCLENLNRLNASEELSAVNKLRCLDYIGLTYGRMEKYEDAINAFTEVIDRANGDPNNIWIGYARMNRGKIHSICKQYALAEEDYLAAVAIRSFIANDEAGLESCLADMGNETQARLTLAMGYENLLRFYMHDKPDSGLSFQYASLLRDAILSAYERRPLETISFMFTCRMLLSLVEYYQFNDGKCSRLQKILAEAYVPKQEAIRYNKIMSQLSGHPDPLSEFMDQFEEVWRSYNDGDRENRKEIRQRYKTVKAQFLSRTDAVSIFIARYGKLLDLDEEELEEDFTIKSLGKIFPS